MNTVQVTLSLYYEIVGADLYGGPESTGYAMVAFDFDTENLGSVKFSNDIRTYSSSSGSLSSTGIQLCSSI